MRRCPRSGLRNCFGQPDSAAFRNEDTINAGTFGRTQDRPQISRVLNTVQGKNQRVLIETIKDLIGVDIIRCCDKCRNTLMMHLAARDAIKLLPGHAVDQEVPLVRQIKNLTKAMLLGPARDHDLGDTSRVGTQRFENRRNTKDNILCRRGSILPLREFLAGRAKFVRFEVRVSRLVPFHINSRRIREYFVNWERFDEVYVAPNSRLPEVPRCNPCTSFRDSGSQTTSRRLRISSYSSAITAFGQCCFRNPASFSMFLLASIDLSSPSTEKSKPFVCMR